MLPLGRFFVYFVLLSRMCCGVIVLEATKSAESGVIEAVVEILKSCYSSRITTVGLAGNVTGMISEELSSKGSLPVTLIGADMRLVGNNPVRPWFRNKLEVFVIAVSSPLTLTRTLERIKASIWWNHMAHFLILDVFSSDPDCSKASELLWAAWEMNILNANLICHHRSKGRLIYTFNPFTDRAPVPWQLVDTYRGVNDHPWALFTREYREAEETCKELDFEKANDLGGYEIRASVANSSHIYKLTKTSGFCFSPISDVFCQILFPALNATPKLRVYNSINLLGAVHGRNNITGVLGEVAHGVIDFGPTPRLLIAMPNLTTAYPHGQAKLYTVTQYSGYKSQLSKICSVVDRRSRICLFLTCLVTIGFFKFFMRRYLSVALLDTLRLICNTGILRIPNNVASRIYLGTLFMFVVTIQGIFQGRLAAVLTNQDPLPNVNTMNDLVKLGHTVHGIAAHKIFFDHPDLEGRFVTVNDFRCAKYVVQDPASACVSTKVVVIFDTAKLKLHMSDHALARSYEAVPIRPDWPLEDRVNTLIMRSVDTYQLQYLQEQTTYLTERILQIQETEYKEKSHKVMTLEQLGFAFAILGIGLGCATISFLIEVIVG